MAPVLKTLTYLGSIASISAFRTSSINSLASPVAQQQQQSLHMSSKPDWFNQLKENFSGKSDKKEASPVSSTFTIGVTGSSGLVGKAFVKSLQGATIGGAPVEVKKFVRSTGTLKEDEIGWSPTDGVVSIDSDVQLDAIVHLAGENIASGDPSDFLSKLTGKWTYQKKESILSSRVLGTKAIVDACQQMKKKPKVVVVASAVGFYGKDVGLGLDQASSVEVDEMAPLGTGFLAEVCRAWEAETKPLAAKTRVVNARFGVVLSREGGTLAKLLPIFQIGGGGIIGNGRQYFSWITLNDAVRALTYLIEESSLKGPVNLVSPQPVTNKEFTAAFGKVLSRPAVVPLPEFVVKNVFGEFGEEVLLGGQRAVPSKLLKGGFTFEESNTIESGIKAALNKK